MWVVDVVLFKLFQLQRFFFGGQYSQNMSPLVASDSFFCFLPISLKYFGPRKCERPWQQVIPGRVEMEAVSETCCPATVEMLPESAFWLRRRGACEFLARCKMGSVRGRMYKYGHLYSSAVINSIQFNS